MASENSTSFHSSQNSPKPSPTQETSNCPSKSEKSKTLTSKTKSNKRKLEEDNGLHFELELGEEDTPETLELEKTLEKELSRFAPGLVVNVEWCKASKYSQFLDILESQHWIKLLGEHAIDYVYPNAILEFCENFDCKKNIIMSKVNGVDIVFDSVVLSEIFEVPDDGYDQYFKGKYNLKINGVCTNDIIESLNGEVGRTHIALGSLSPLNKLLFNLTWKSIVPRTQKRNDVGLLDCAIIYCLANKIQLNFPSLMMSHLTHSVMQHNKIGYNTLLTKIFKHFKVPLDGYKRLSLKRDQYVQGSTLRTNHLGILDGKTETYAEVMRVMSERKQKQAEKRGTKVMRDDGEKKLVVARKSRRLISKIASTGPTPSINLVDDDDEPLLGKGSKGTTDNIVVEDILLQILKELQYLHTKQEDLEGQVFMMRESLTHMASTSERRHAEILRSLKELDIEEVVPSAADDGTAPTGTGEGTTEVPSAVVPTDD